MTRFLVEKMAFSNRVVRKQKEITSFLLVLVFLYAGLFRSVFTSDAEDIVPNYASHDSDTKSNLSTQQNHFNGFSITNQYKDKGESEIDEAHVDFEVTFTSHSPFTFLPYQKFISSNELNRFDFLKKPLYDLFCNWKFHLI